MGAEQSSAAAATAAAASTGERGGGESAAQVRDGGSAAAAAMGLHGASIEPVEPSGQPLPLVICGPSGVGKGTLIKRLMEEFPTKFG